MTESEVWPMNPLPVNSSNFKMTHENHSQMSRLCAHNRQEEGVGAVDAFARTR
jgi:hypothetical protein